MSSGSSLNKPLALVVIGLLVGASLGLGSGYAVFYPEMVRQKSKSLEDRVSSLEANVSSIYGALEAVNQSMASVESSLEELGGLVDAVEALGGRVSTLENGQITLGNQLAEVESLMEAVQEGFTGLQDQWGGVADSFQEVEQAYQEALEELLRLHALIKQGEAVELVRGALAKPPNDLKLELVDLLYGFMEGDPDFDQWVSLYGENTAKILLKQEVDSLDGALVWNPVGNATAEGEDIRVRVETWFQIEFTPAQVSLRGLHLVVEALANPQTGEVWGYSTTLEQG